MITHIQACQEDNQKCLIWVQEAYKYKINRKQNIWHQLNWNLNIIFRNSIMDSAQIRLVICYSMSINIYHNISLVLMIALIIMNVSLMMMIIILILEFIIKGIHLCLLMNPILIHHQKLWMIKILQIRNQIRNKQTKRKNILSPNYLLFY